MSRPRSSTRGRAIALTGGLASGKSAAAAVLAELGAAVLDTDDVAHDLLSRDTEVRARVVGAFGAKVAAADGSVDRKALGAIVFADPDALRRLNALMHPAIMARVESWVSETTAAGRDAVVVIPLLFEIGAERGWDAVVCVAADDSRAAERLRARGLNDEEVRRRMEAQWPVAEKARRADFVIENNGSLDDLAKAAAATYQRLREKEKRTYG